MPSVAEAPGQPLVGQCVLITRGPLEGVAGIVSMQRGKEWIIELAECGAGVYLVTDAAHFEATREPFF